MNRIYRLIWSAVRQCWIVAAEKVSAKGGIPARTVGALSVAVLLACGTAHALPTGGAVAAGSASISNPAVGQMQITQTSNRAVINWQSFGIAKGESVNITQPSSNSALLNRVIGNSSSEIYGSLTATGQVFLVNPNGVLFAKGASVNVGGLVASSLNITDDNFMNNNLTFFKHNTAGSITNQGSITAGFAALLGPTVDNSGSIITYKGSTALGAANAVTLDFDTSGLIALTLTEGAYNAQVQNSGIIEADGGRVLVTAKSADNILKSMVNNTGIIRARSVDTSSGQILLLGDMDNGTVKVGGTLDASGGFVETSAHDVSLQSGAGVKAKSWLIDPTDITIDATEAAVLVSALDGGTNVTETTSSGGTDAGNITVASAVTWTGTGALTLNADNNIAINAAITGTNGGLTLSAGNSISAPAAVSVGTFTLNSGAWSQIGSSLPSFSATDFRISGGSFIRALSGDGSSSNPYALADIYGVQGMGSSGMLTNSYVLANDIDASGTATWNSGSGFKPIGSASVTISDSSYANVTVTITNSDAFTGSLDGQNHVIDGLTISRPSETLVGLFGYTGSGSSISNIGLTNASITGFALVGALAGYNTGNLDNVYATGALIGDAISDGNYRSLFVGGLVGYQLGNISNSHYSGSITGQNGWTYEYFGGLTGYLNGNISNSYAEGSISGIYSGDSTSSLHLYYLGGLTGYQTGNISSSHADVDINGSTGAPRIGAYYVGGLAGWFTSGSISDSYATGNIHFDVTSGIMYQDYIGGLVGYGYGTIGIADSHYSGSINGDTDIGGLIGYLDTYGTISIDNSYSEGTITSRYGYVGGLIGADYVYSAGGSITNSYSTATIVSTSRYSGGLLGYGSHISVSDSYHLGTVSGYNYVGGLVGYTNAAISNSYAEGDVTSEGSYVGGLVGQTSSTVSNSHATGNVITTGSDTDYVGGLIGYTTGAVSNSYATGNVTAASADYVGGLIGYTTANVSNTYATGDVTGYSQYVGGLVGMLEGTNLTISDSHATGAVLGSSTGYVPSLGYDVYTSMLVGGLVGQLNGDNTNITNSYATGNVTGGTKVGGLVGGTDYDGDIANHQHFISNSYATGDVTATNRVINYSESGIAGGLVGQADGLVITNSYATGNVSGRNAGGLVGWEYGGYLNDDDTATDGWGRIVNSYATGSVSGGSYHYFSCTGTCTTLSSRTGGLLGFNQGGVNIINSYAVGAVSSTDTTYVGGLSGGTGWSGGTISNSFWNTETTGQSSAVGGSYTLSNVTGLTTAQMKTASNFSSAGWDISTTSGSTAVWRIYDGYTYPLLRSFLTPLTVTPAYDGSGTALTNIAAVTGTGSYDSSLLLGSATSTTLTLSSSSAGSYTASANAGSSGLYSTQQGYDLSYADRSITTTGSAAGDIVISNPITWSSGTLAINTSGAVTANAAVNGSGSAIFDLQSGVWNQVASSLPDFNVYDFRISGGTFIRALSGDGTSSTPYQLADIYGVQGIGSSGMRSKYYLLANDIDASGTANWNSGSGFKPIGDSSHTFTGSFDGQSHTIDGLTINRSSEILVGLFGINYGTISNLTMTHADVTGDLCVGALVGCNMEGGTISNVSVQGSVVATEEQVGLVAGGNNDGGTISNATASGSVSGVSNVGGLVGVNWGVLSNASASATVTGTYEVGGLVGENAGSISSSHASGDVSGDQYVGGLVGHNVIGTASDAGRMTDVYATGNVSGNYWVGGLAGASENGTVIRNAHATGSVTGSEEVGGLVGHNDGGSISASYATGSVTGGSGSTSVGGLVGENWGSIATSYATGNVSGGSLVGGLAGYNFYGDISNSYATGSVTASGDYVGGLAGSNDYSTISNSYATGAVTGGSSATTGGLVGNNNNDSTIGNSFFNTNTTGQSSAVGDNTGTLTNVGGKTTAEMMSASTFSSWDIGTTGGSSAVWRIYDGYTYPLLRSFLTALSVSMNGGSKIYDGTTDVSSTASYSITPDASLLLGTLSAATSNKNVGSYSVAASGLYSTQQGYDISYVNGTVTITAKAASVSGTATSTTYNGTTQTQNAATTSGFISGDDISISGLASGRNAGTYTSNLSIGGSDAGNYTVTYNNADLTIAKATLTISAVTNSKIYDGSTDAAATPTYSGLQTGDSLGNLTETYASKNVLGANNSTLNVSGYSLNDGNSGNNYTVVTATAAGSITPKVASVTGTATTTTYNGATQTQNAATTSGFISGDDISISGLASGRNAGTYTSSLSIGGSDAGNYTVSYTNADLTIGRAAVIVSSSDITKTYDGTTSASGNGTITSGTLFGTDSIDYSGLSYAFSNKNAGTNKTVTVNGNAAISDGNSGNNYTVSYVNNTTSAISPKAASVSGTTTSTTYNGATQTQNAATTSGFISGDDISISGLASGRNAGTYTSNLSIGGSDAGNYIVSYTNADLSIGKKGASVSGSATSTTYNGTTQTQNAAATSGFISGDDISISGLASGRNAGTYTSSLSIGGSDAGNYTVSYTNADLTIGRAAVIVSSSDITKTYDGTTSASGNGTITSGTLFGTDSIDYSGLSYAFSNKNAGTNKTVIVNGNAAISDGNSGNNYTVSYVNNTTSAISPKAASVSGTATTATYNGATQTQNAATTSGFISGDDISISGLASGRNVGTYTSNLSIGGSDAGNYTVSYTNADLTISPKAASVSGSATSTTYNGATQTQNAATTSGFISGDDISISGLASGRNAGTYTSSLSIGGSDAGNYTVSYTNADLTITPKALTINGLVASTKTYDGSTSATLDNYGALDGLVNGEDLRLDSSSVSGSFSDKNVGTGKTVTVSGYSLSNGINGQASNYILAAASITTVADITPKTLAISGNTTAADKTYDATTSVSVSGGTLSGVITGDTVVFFQSGSFGDKNVGTGKTVTYSNRISGSDSGNYVLDSTSGNTTANIAPASLTIAANSAVVTYSGSAYSGGNGVSYSGLVGGEDASVLSGSLRYSGTSQGAVAVGSYVITPGGLSNSNYIISFVDGTLAIRPVGNLSDQLVPLLSWYYPHGNSAGQQQGTQPVFGNQQHTPLLFAQGSRAVNDLIVVIDGGVGHVDGGVGR